MLKKFIGKIPPHFGLLIKLYFLSLILFLFIRVFFYAMNHSQDTGTVPFFEKFWAFRMGLEFDTAVFCWIAYLPVLIWSLASLFKNSFAAVYRAGFIAFLILLCVYYFVSVANIPYFAQFGSHLNKNALLWNENPGFVLGMIFGNFSYWGYLLLFLVVMIAGIVVSKKIYKDFQARRQSYKFTDYIAFTKNYLNIKGGDPNTIDRQIKDSLKTKYNFVIVVMESMSVFKMGYYNGKNLTPHFNKLISESVFFDNFFSSGIHTFNGLFSTTSGFPSIYAEKSMKSYVKKPFQGLGPLLREQGYETYFYTTHDPHFDNMQGFFKLNKFDHFISQYDFNFTQAESSLGVPDHLLFDKLLEVTNSRKTGQPFTAVVMTASDHGPWKIPQDIPFKPAGADEKENCTLYADWSIGRFMEQAKQMPWYNNTVFLFLGDHGLSMGHTYEMPLSYNHVPFVIHQPALFKPDTISSPAFQPDVPATVMGIIGASYTDKTFGINLLKQKHPFVVFSADDKIGCVDDQGFYFYKTLANDQTYLRKYKQLDPKNYCETNKARADSMNHQMMKIYQTAEFFIRKDYEMGYN
ncbi:MAG: sulfatase [Bacteroidetes bacterium]|nr:sulfatase [Bacteroidota bacterium]